MSTAHKAYDHYFQLHGLRAEAPAKLNRALQTAIEQLQTNLYGPSRSELTAAEIAMLERAGVDLDEHPELQDPMMVYATEFAAILATSLTPKAVAKRVNLTPVRVRQLIRDHSLFAIRVEGRWKIPAFQIDGNRIVPNIGQVNACLAGLDAVSVMRWYTTADPELEDDQGRAMSPLDWLKSGRNADVVAKITPET